MSPAIQKYFHETSAYQGQISESINGVSEDVKALNATIEKLQSTQGELTPEDQALLDQLQAQGKELADRLKTVDEQTPPVAPPEASRR